MEYTGWYLINVVGERQQCSADFCCRNTGRGQILRLHQACGGNSSSQGVLLKFRTYFSPLL